MGGTNQKNLIKPNPQKKNLIKLNLQNLLNQKNKLISNINFLEYKYIEKYIFKK